VGYVFTINLLWRLVWGFIGGPYSRWKAVLPVGRGFIAALSSQLRDIRSGNSEPHAGHSPLGRIAVTVIFFFLLVQGATGLTNYYFLLALILFHIIAVISAEMREGGSIISAMFTGKKTLAKKPE